MRTLGDMARACSMAPGGSRRARLGREEDVPCVKGRKKHQFNVPAWFSFYLLVNALSVFCCYLEVNSRYNEMDKWQPIVLVAYLALAYAAVGALFDGRRHGPRLEVARLLLFLLLSRAYPLFEAPAVNQAHALVLALSLLLSPATSWPRRGSQTRVAGPGRVSAAACAVQEDPAKASCTTCRTHFTAD
ncbi:putative alkylglycerol monooxygenase-like [Penaeus vannamei]|uniref:Putative alkylglycerol monooxygenase-like n=1 Tax=Penaeus vannamei TaxID=6689 RepID=A0A3R7MGB7_PENVA|nr:putative alkylglycerol monooxygenase-like [Penaeus vannamei]